MVNVVSFMEFRNILETHLWAHLEGCFQGGLIKEGRPIPNLCGTIPWDGSLWLDLFLFHLPAFSHEFVMILHREDNVIVFPVSL